MIANEIGSSASICYTAGHRADPRRQRGAGGDRRERQRVVHRRKPTPRARVVLEWRCP
jgi:hypothetical protein